MSNRQQVAQFKTVDAPHWGTHTVYIEVLSQHIEGGEWVTKLEVTGGVFNGQQFEARTPAVEAIKVAA